MARNRVGERGQAIFEYLRADLGQPHRFSDLCAALDLQDGSTTRSAIRHARELATEAGLHFPVACPANGMTYTVTDDPTAAFDPALHLARIEQGVATTKRVAVDFMRYRERQIAPGVRPLAKGYLTMEQNLADAAASVQKAYDVMTKTLVDARRAMRDPG